MPLTKLGYAMATKRFAMGKTQGELAWMLGITERSYNVVESGHVQTPRPETIRAIRDVMGIDVAAIVGIA